MEAWILDMIDSRMEGRDDFFLQKRYEEGFVSLMLFIVFFCGSMCQQAIQLSLSFPFLYVSIVDH